jgi:anhydro-N-acetylmuramic acid kinase
MVGIVRLFFATIKPFEPSSMPAYLCLGLMSGSSLDGLDVALCSFEVSDENPPKLKNWSLQETETLPFSADWQGRLANLPNSNAFSLAQAHADFGHYMGALVHNFFSKNGISPGSIDFIASHGHTIFHEPSLHFSTQIGDGAALAVATGCTVVCDFRTSDVALGGQGAPLAPLADKVLFPGYDFYLNLGGIANLTCHTPEKYIAFDVCAANQALNSLAKEAGFDYDEDGKMAASGQLLESLFDHLNDESFFYENYPKSLSNQWVQANTVAKCAAATGSVTDRLHTACQHVGYQLARAIRHISEKEGFKKDRYRLLATGGGALNSFLIQCIEQQCQSFAEVEVVLPEMEIIKFKEAILMALLGILRIESSTNCLSTVTGASRDAAGGAIYLAG